ncbi:protein of unknown function [Pseudomonas sp. JV551A1]|uniref:Uncharacterized protein n=1 Tax=Pseudomonas inefficax TaxID=2078786 RepID=A0AAQ1P4U5_9PSED|nr:protein of unknown function [Pseudomonas sp. JV551A1]SPO58522.1 protein of unknown function [Pseudomonas inefficax]
MFLDVNEQRANKLFWFVFRFFKLYMFARKRLWNATCKQKTRRSHLQRVLGIRGAGRSRQAGA